MLACSHAGHIVFHGPREDVMPFFNSMVRNSCASLLCHCLLKCTGLVWQPGLPVAGLS